MTFQYTPSQIAKLIVDAYDSSSGVFVNKVNAEDLVPYTTKENQVQFLFWVIQMDYATKSAALYKKANALWLEDAKWIDALYLLNLSEKAFQQMIKEKLRPRYSNEISLRFRNNGKLLLEKYKGKAMNIVKAAKSAADLLNRIYEFRGFGPKTGNFLTRTYIDLLKLKYNDINEILQPVDVHDVRLTYEWGLIPSRNMTKSNINIVKSIWNRACKEANVSWIKFDKALWLIGSEGVRTGDALEDFIKNIGIVK